MRSIISALNSPLARRLGFHFIFTCSLITLLLSWNQVHIEHEMNHKEMLSEIVEFETSLLYTIENKLWKLDLEDLDVILNGGLNAPYINYIAVYNEKNDLIESVGAIIEEDSINKSYPLIYEQEENLYAIGSVKLNASQTLDHKDYYWEIVKLYFNNLIYTLIAALIFFFLFYQIIGKHILAISKHAISLDLINILKPFEYDRKPNPINKLDELDALKNGLSDLQKQLFNSFSDLKFRENEKTILLNSMLNAMISTDSNGNILSINRAAEVLFGYKSTEIIGRNVKVLMPEKTAKQSDKFIKNFLHKQSLLAKGEIREIKGVNKKGQLIPLQLSIALLPKGKSGMHRLVGTMTDLTNYKKQESQIRQSIKYEALGQLTGGIAHDFNNILNIILGYVLFLKTSLKDQPDIIDQLNEINIAGNRGVDLIKKLLAYSKAKPVKASNVDINEVLISSKNLIKKILTSRIKLEYRLTNDLWPVYLDRNDLEDVIVNLCINSENALRLNVSNPTLQVITSNESLNAYEAKLFDLSEGNYVKLTFADNGIGMSEETKGSIFDPFFTTKGHDGTGLGLSQVSGFIKRSKGVINVNSRLYKGTSFEMYFPQSIKNDEKINIISPQTKTVYRGNESILLVEDDSAQRILLKKQLTEKGYRVQCADNGKEAIKLVEYNYFALIITDIVMPKMDGLQLISNVKQKHSKMKFLLISGYNKYISEDDTSLNLEVLYKPFEIEDLLEKIRSVLDQ